MNAANTKARAPDVRILETAEEWARAAAGEIVRCAKEAASRKGRFTLALAGGETPRPVYELLATHPAFLKLLPWRQTHVFWSDERCVPADHRESNFRMAHEALLSRVPVPAANIHRIPAEMPDPAFAAQQYEKKLREFFRAAPGRFPRFDLILLGMGADGHTASLFPGSTALEDEHALVSAVAGPKGGVPRITFTLPLINHAASVVFLVFGAGKSEGVREILTAAAGSMSLPAARVRPGNGNLLWILDRGAAAML